MNKSPHGLNQAVNDNNGTTGIGCSAMKKSTSFSPAYPRWNGNIGFAPPKRALEPLQFINRFLIGSAFLVTLILVGTHLTAI
ncbi:MAG: hypothetical protein ACFCUJ_05775 [Thiotrichales bacterium]